MSTGTIPVVQPEPQTAGDARRTAELEASQSLAQRYGELAHTFEPRPVDAALPHDLASIADAEAKDVRQMVPVGVREHRLLC